LLIVVELSFPRPVLVVLVLMLLDVLLLVLAVLVLQVLLVLLVLMLLWTVADGGGTINVISHYFDFCCC